MWRPASAAVLGVFLGVLLAFAPPGEGRAQTVAAPPAAPGAPAPAPTADAAADAPAEAGVEVGVIETLRHGELDLVARHVRPDEAGLATVLIVHDTLGAFDAPFVAQLQAGLANRGFASLAVNLSLNQSGRMTSLDCNARHTHRHEDALDEIDLWVDWLLGEGLGPVILAGHGRGGAQAAWHLAARAKDRVAAAMLLAPTGWTPRQADAEYRARYAAGLSALLTRIAGKEADEWVENVPFLHCGAVDATKAAIESYYGAEPMRDAPTALAETKTPTLAFVPGEAASSPENDTPARLADLDNPAVVVRVIPDADAQFSGDAFEPTMKAVEAYLRSILAP